MTVATVDIAAGKSHLPEPKDEFLCLSPDHCSFCGAEIECDETTGGKSCSQCGRGPNSSY